MMADAHDNREIRNKDLSLVEVLLQTCIQGITSNLNKPFVFTNQTKQQLLASDVRMRHDMRTLRRWRNGTEQWSHDDLDEFSRRLVAVRLETLRTRLTIMKDTVSELDVSLDKLGDCSNTISPHVQRKNIVWEMITIQEKVDNIEQINGKGTTRCEIEVAAIEDDILNLRSLVLKELRLKDKKKNRRPLSSVSADSVDLTIRFEDHPEVNRVLRNAAYIRKMTEAFRDGGHVTISDTSDCVENDVEVLRRQLGKVQQWQQGEVNFRLSDVEDLELILSAIQRHIRPDVDLEACKRKSTPSTSRSNSRGSEKSRESQYQNTSQDSTEAPPPYEVACVAMTTNCFTNTYDDDDDIIDERLI